MSSGSDQPRGEPGRDAGLGTGHDPGPPPPEVLRRVSLFRECGEVTLAALAASLETVVVPANGVVCLEGDPGDRFYVVAEGTLAVTAEVGGRRRSLAEIGAGDFFGEIALLGGGRRTATVVAMTDARLWALSAASFTAVMERDRKLRAVVFQAALARSRRSDALAYEVQHRNLADLLEGRNSLRVGRHPRNDLVLDSRVVSEFHAVINRSGQTYELVDLSSDAGTFVNGRQVSHTGLQPGDEIWVGDQRFLFELSELTQVFEPRGIRIDAIGVSKRVKGDVVLLHDIGLSILPGELVAIVGGSGAGKSTLLDALSGVRPANGGRVLYNGRDHDQNMALFRNSLGYVPQDDIIGTELPLRRTLRHAARLRLPADTSRAAVDEAVDQAIDHLGLRDQAELPVHRVSGGQRKRCSIGVELLTEPRIFFLDEPTSGLDPATDGQMMRLMRRLADDGSTVVVTTHATKNVRLCDKVVFLAAGGHLAYVGPPEGALAYFGTTEFDEIYDLLHDQDTPAEWARRFEESDARRAVEPATEPVESTVVSGQASLTSRVRAGIHQFAVLSARNWDARIHDPAVIGPYVGQAVGLTVVLLALFNSGIFNVGRNPSAPLQVMLLLAFMAFLIGLLGSIQEIVKELPVFLRERMVGVGVLPYLLSKLAFLAPASALSVSFTVVVLRIFNRLPAAGVSFYLPLLVSLVLAGLGGVCIGLMTSSFANTTRQATDVLSLWIMPQVLFSGALIAVPSINVVGRLLSNLMVVRWAFEGAGDAADLVAVFKAAKNPLGDGLVQQYGSSFTNALPGHWLILLLFVVVPIVVAWFVLRRKQPAR